ncbi:MAG: bifunctional riboflavin kinase/FAD synthetase [Alphaproteobacteria bacterium]|nr:bifunctional riboflavin kinase/FAD synthetase [Alphaproteobacteria bacterium]
MLIVQDIQNVPAAARGGALAIGNFDGVHLGHQSVIGEARLLARAMDAPSAVLTFDPHPRRFFRPDDRLFELTPAAAKQRQIAALGVDALFLLRFDANFAAIPAEEFVARIVLGALGARHIVVGYDFVFGKGRAGDADLLRRMGAEAGVGVTVVDAVRSGGGEIYSSTTIRGALREGRVRDAARLLGRMWEIEGEVLHGDERGRRIGFPTANVDPGQYVQPAFGVYAVRVGIPAGKGGEVEWHPGVVNIGRRPTFKDGDAGIAVEAHVFDYAGDLYGRMLRIALVDFIRPERKFDGLDAIRAQISEDCVTARAMLDGAPPAAAAGKAG